jgi:hypothetical protein
MLFAGNFIIKLNAMWQHGLDIHVYRLRQPVPWCTLRTKCPLIKFLVAHNLHIKHDYWNWMQYDNTVWGTIIAVSAKIKHQNFLMRNFGLCLSRNRMAESINANSCQCVHTSSIFYQHEVNICSPIAHEIFWAALLGNWRKGEEGKLSYK